MQGLIGKKTDQTQGFLQDGTRVPLTVIYAIGNTVAQVKTMDKDRYNSIKLAFGQSKKKDKAGKNLPAFFREVDGDVQTAQLGSQINPSDVFKPGDIVDVSGVSKGKGFAGVVKRHHFKGGPRTHGQSDRERAPGSIGQTTTPGHVYRGKRMAGHMGHGNVTVKNLEVIDITNDGAILIKGLVPGPKNGIVIIKKVDNKQGLRPSGLKKFIPLYKETLRSEELKEVQEEVKTEPQAQAPVEEPKSEVQSEEVVHIEEKKEEVKENAS